MTLPDAARNVYTDAPQIHSNWILGSLQLFFWLFVHPSAWRHHVARIDPNLRPDFALTELSRDHWRNPVLRRLLITGHLVWPLVTGIVVGLALWASGRSDENVAFGLAFGMVFSIVFGLAVSLAGSVAGGAAGGVAGGFAFGMALPLMGGVAYGVVGGVAGGVAGGIIGTIAGRASISSNTRLLSSIVFGIGVGGAALVTVAYTPFSIPKFDTGSLAGSMADYTSVVMKYAIVVAFAGWLHTHKWKATVTGGLVFGVTVGVASGVAYNIMGHATSGVTYNVMGGEDIGMTVAALSATLFLSAFAAAERVGGTWSGAIAGALTIGGAWTLATVRETGVGSPAWIVLGGLMGISLGLMQARWRPPLFYPLTAAWNTLLYQTDQRRCASHPGLLRWHSAFWDEHQRLRLAGLDEHLVMVAEHDPAEAAIAMEYLTTSHQRWAAQAAQIELDARHLQSCRQVEAIGLAYRRLAAGELEGPASALLRSFGRISQDANAALRQESNYNQRLALRAIESDLDGLLRDLTRSSDRYAVRFTPIATQWRDVVACHAKKLAEAAELRQGIDSPYVIGVPLTDQQEIFVGRTDIGRRIEQLLLDQRRPPQILYGQRRTGKTSLLNNLGRLLPSTVIPLFVDLQGPATQTSDHAGFLFNLARSMTDSAQRQRSLELPPLDRDSLTADPFTRFDEWLNEVETALGSKTALLSLDEFEALDRALTQGRFSDADVLGMLRNLMQHRPHFKVLLAGSHTLEELERWAGYLINVQVVHISYLKVDEARKLIEQPVADFALRYEPDASQRVLDLTRCHPFLVQLLCGEIVALKNEQEVALRRLARLSDVEAAAHEALSHGSFFFADIERNQVDADGLAILRALATRGEGVAISRQQLASQLTNPALNERSLASLIQRELIEPTDEGYRFQVELIRRWFANRSS